MLLLFLKLIVKNVHIYRMNQLTGIVSLISVAERQNVGSNAQICDSNKS